MYVFKGSFLRAKNSRDGYLNVDTSTMLMGDILENYVDGYIILSNTQLTGTMYITINALRTAKVRMVTTMTMNQWFAYTSNDQLPTTQLIPRYKQSTVLYSDAFAANFKVDCIGRYLPLNANISKADKVDLLLRKNVPNKNDLYTKVVTTVNGLTHRSFAHEDGIAVAGGGSTFNNTGINTVGILSFAKSCNVRQYAITESMISSSSSTVPLYNELLINLGVSLENKSIMVSIGGHLFVNKGVGEVVNPETGIILVKLVKLNLVKMILNTVGKINLDSLGVFAVDKSMTYNKVRVEDIKSDVCVKKYMTLDQSFVIVADTQCIQTQYDNLGISGLPGSYESRDEPMYPIVNSQGMMPEYWKSKLGDYWSVKITDDVTKRQIHLSNLDYANETINGISGTHQWYHDDPKLMRIITTSKI